MWHYNGSEKVPDEGDEEETKEYRSYDPPSDNSGSSSSSGSPTPPPVKVPDPNASKAQGGTNDKTSEKIPWYKKILLVDPLGWGSNAPQRVFGYQNLYDAISYLLVGTVIDGTQIDMGEYQIRLWKGHYSFWGSGGEVGFYHNDGTVFEEKDFEKYGIENTEMELHKKDGTLVTKRKDSGSYWINAFTGLFSKDHFIDRSNLTTVNTIGFNSVEARNNFYNTISQKSVKDAAALYFFNHDNSLDIKNYNDPLKLSFSWGR